MGKSPTIKNLSETDQEFTKFMEEMGKNVRAAAETYMGEFQASIQKFYTDAGGNYIQFAAKQHEDYQVETEFSLKNIAEVIERSARRSLRTSRAMMRKSKRPWWPWANIPAWLSSWR